MEGDHGISKFILEGNISNESKKCKLLLVAYFAPWVLHLFFI